MKIFPFAFGLWPLALSPNLQADEVVSSTFTSVEVSTVVSVAVSTPTPIVNSTPLPVAVSTPAFVTVVHPLEGAKLPSLKDVFVFGAVTPGSTLTINGIAVPVHPKGGYLTMIPLTPGEILLSLDATAPGGAVAHLDRRFTVAPGPVSIPATPLTIIKESISPAEDLLLMAGDTVRVTFQGSPQGHAEFSIAGIAHHIPMLESGNRGFYEGAFVIPSGQHALQAGIFVTLKTRELRKEQAKGRLTILSGEIPRMGVITEETVATRTAVDGGYDVFLYKGMHVALSGKIGTLWRIRFSAVQSGWIKESAVQELPPGHLVPRSTLSNITITHQPESTLIRVPMSDVLPYRVEQTLQPPMLVVSLFGAVDKTDLIRYDPADPLIGLVRWRQITGDTCQLILSPKFKTWWGFDVRYEGSTLVIEVRKPWTDRTLHGMAIAVDAGHGGSDKGAVGPHETLEKDANLMIARIVKDLLEKAGAKPFLTRDKDVDVSLYERPRIAWKNKARLFVSVHCNASGLGENPLASNGSSVYWNQPQSQALAMAVHASYRKLVPMLPDRGLYYADFAVCRMTQMPAILTEQAYIILPDQEADLFDPLFQKNLANAIVGGIKSAVANP